MAVESGKEYNPETARDLRPKDFEFIAFGEAFRYTLQVPEYILARLDSCILDKLQDYMDEHARVAVVDAMKGGYYHTESGRRGMRSEVGKHLKNYLWERFSITQETAGFDCWQTAPTLQKVHTT